MLTLEKVVAFALRDMDVLETLSEPLTSDLVVARPFDRQLIQFTKEFSRKHRKLPGAGDYDVWTSTLPEDQREGVQNALNRARSEDLSGYTAGHIAEHALEELRRAAAMNAVSRLNVDPAAVTPKAFGDLAEKIAAISTNGRKVPAEQWPTLKDLSRDPTLTREPDEIIPRLVWRGSFTVLAGLPFVGKSTLGAEGAAAVSQGGGFLDGKAVKGRVLWCNVADEPLGRTVQRLTALLADGNRVRIYDFREPTQNLLDSLKEVMDEFEPDVLVIDSLIAWARATTKEIPSGGDAAAWTKVTRPLSELAHQQNTGVLTYHHARRQDGKYRDSGEIAAAADVLIEMLPARGCPANHRRFEAESRLSGRTRWEAAYRDGLYRFVGETGAEDVNGGDDAADRMAPAIFKYVAENPDCSKNAVMRGVTGDDKAKSAALDLLVERGEVVIDEPTGRGKASKIRVVEGAQTDPEEASV